MMHLACHEYNWSLWVKNECLFRCSEGRKFYNDRLVSVGVNTCIYLKFDYPPHMYLVLSGKCMTGLVLSHPEAQVHFSLWYFLWIPENLDHHNVSWSSLTRIENLSWNFWTFILSRGYSFSFVWGHIKFALQSIPNTWFWSLLFHSYYTWALSTPSDAMSSSSHWKKRVKWGCMAV